MINSFASRTYSKFPESWIICFGFCGVVASIAFSFLIESFIPAFIIIMIFVLLVHPAYILGMIIILNPFSDWIAAELPFLLTKELIDILIISFILGTARINIGKKKQWVKVPTAKFIFMFIILYIISSLFYWKGFEEFLFMNWIHFRFIYLAIAITQVDLNDRKYSVLIKLILVIYFIHIALGLFQVIFGEWAKSLFYEGESQQVSLSYRLLQFKSYDTGVNFNVGGASYIYSTFFTPTHYGGFLVLMLCLSFGMGKAAYLNRNYRWTNVFPSIFLNKRRYVLLLALTTLLIISTFSRSTYMGYLVLISFVILSSGKPLRKLVIYEAALLVLLFFIANSEFVLNYLNDLGSPEIGIFDPVSRVLSVFTHYLTEETPRKIAYRDILPRVIIEFPFLGLGVNSVLNQEKFFTDSIALNNALFYVYGDAGIVRISVEYGVLGSLIYALLFVSAFKYARKRYLVSTDYKERAICFTVMTSITTIVPVSIGTMLLLAKSYGLYIWMFIGLSQNMRGKSIAANSSNHYRTNIRN